MAKKVAHSRDLVDLLEQGTQSRPALHRAVCLFTQLDESEYQYLTLWAKRRAPNMLRVIKIFFDRLQRRRANQASGIAASTGEGRWVSLKERVYMANQATQPDQLIAALRDADPEVFNAALENRGLKAQDLVSVIPGLDGPQAERVAGHRAWRRLPTVCEALVHNPHLSVRTSLDLLRGLKQPRILLDILRDQRLPHLEVKQLALEKLRATYQEMSVPHRILALRASGGELLRHLPQEILDDAETLTCWWRTARWTRASCSGWHATSRPRARSWSSSRPTRCSWRIRRSCPSCCSTPRPRARPPAASGACFLRASSSICCAVRICPPRCGT